jgi:hypothetical protein
LLSEKRDDSDTLIYAINMRWGQLQDLPGVETAFNSAFSAQMLWTCNTLGSEPTGSDAEGVFKNKENFSGF